MRQSMMFVAGLAVCCAESVSGSGPVWTEIPDAGKLPGNAQTPTGIGMLGAIEGELTGNNAIAGAGDFQDVYRIEILTAGFSIETVPLLDGDPTFNMSLWLFDEFGVPVAGNLDKDLSGLSILGQPTDGGAPIGAGIYFLAISGDGSVPVNAIGDPQFFFDPGDPFEISGPDGPGGSTPIFDWDALEGEIGRYRIELTGVGFAKVPAPGSAVILLGLLVMKRRRR